MTLIQAPRPSRPARRIAGLSMEGAYAMAARVAQLRATGRHVTDLSIGEPDIPVPLHVLEAGQRALGSGPSRYGPAAGLPELRDAIACDLTTTGATASAEQVVVTPGAKAGLLYAFLACVEAGSEVLVPDPGFPAYPSLARLAGARPVAYGLLPGAERAPDTAEIAARISGRTSAIVLNLPGNPAGSVATHAVLEAVADLADRHGLWIIADEIYGRLILDARPRTCMAALPGIASRTIVVDGCSKAWGMTGWRLGWAVFPAPLAPAAVSLAVNGHSCTPGFVQAAAVAALTGPDRPVREACAALRDRRDVLVGGLRGIPGVRCDRPRGAFYAFPDFSAVLAACGLRCQALADLLLERHGLATLPGTDFGPRGEGHLRLSFAAAPDQVARALDLVATCVHDLTHHPDHPR